MAPESFIIPGLGRVFLYSGSSLLYMPGREPGKGSKWPKVFSERVKVFFIPGSWPFGAYGPDPGSFFLRGFLVSESFIIPGLGRVFSIPGLKHCILLAASPERGQNG